MFLFLPISKLASFLFLLFLLHFSVDNSFPILKAHNFTELFYFLPNLSHFLFFFFLFSCFQVFFRLLHFYVLHYFSRLGEKAASKNIQLSFWMMKCYQLQWIMHTRAPCTNWLYIPILSLSLASDALLHLPTYLMFGGREKYKSAID